MKEIIEVLFDDGDKGFYWPMCAKENCKNFRTHDSDLYCYPHSRWYRPIKRYLNIIVSLFERDAK